MVKLLNPCTMISELWRQIKTHEYAEQIQVLGHCGEAVTQ